MLKHQRRLQQITIVVSVSLLVCNALKKQETREKEYENNWHD